MLNVTSDCCGWKSSSKKLEEVSMSPSQIFGVAGQDLVIQEGIQIRIGIEIPQVEAFELRNPE